MTLTIWSIPIRLGAVEKHAITLSVGSNFRLVGVCTIFLVLIGVNAAQLEEPFGCTFIGVGRGKLVRVFSLPESEMMIYGIEAVLSNFRLTFTCHWEIRGKFRSQIDKAIPRDWLIFRDCCLCLCRVALSVLGNWQPFLVYISLLIIESQPNCHKQFGIIQSEWMQWLRGTSCQICVSNARNQAQQVFGGVLEWCFSILRMYNVDWLSKRDVILVAAGLELFPCILVGTVKELHRILDDWMVDIIISYIKCWRSWAQFRRYKRWRS